MLAQIKEWWTSLKLREKFAFSFLGILAIVLTIFITPAMIIFGVFGGFVGSMVIVISWFVENFDD